MGLEVHQDGVKKARVMECNGVIEIKTNINLRGQLAKRLETT